ncbi:MAG: hypothetical protein HQM16_18820 [Deltaproteobacteria bacterium]|nr:hypothetical protein [Deltaproteobacteria bacterium]
MSTPKKAMKVYTILEGKEKKANWKQIGLAFVNSDDSLNVFLHALPINGKLHIRNFNEK